MALVMFVMGIGIIFVHCLIISLRAQCEPLNEE